MKSSRYYQTYLQIVSRSGEAAMFFSGVFLGKEHYKTAALIFILRLLIGSTTSELMYRRMKAVTREEVNCEGN